MRRGLTVLLAALITTASGSVVAWAHDDDPTLVSQLTEVRPALPSDVLVQVRTGYSAQMLVANPTGTDLTILDPDGIAFLRISSAGVFGNVADPYLDRSENPSDAPARPPSDAEPRWVSLSRGDTWGWFEPRLYPPAPTGKPIEGAGPGGVAPQRQVLASWQVGMRYGDRPVTAVGVLERRPITGTFRATADPRDDQFGLGIGQGQLPAIQLQVPPGRTVIVGGRDGVPFLRIDGIGVAANPASVHYRDNPQFQGLPTGQDGWIRVSDAPTVTWLDSRLRYGSDRPPDAVATGSEVVTLEHWSIPVTVDGERRTLRGRIDWIPSASMAALVRTPVPGSDFPWVTVGFAVGAIALLGAIGGLRRRNRPRTTR